MLRLGLTGGYVSRTFDWDKLTFGDLIDPRYGFVYPTTEERPPSSKKFFDCGIGVAAYMKNFYLNGAIDHLNEPDESFIKKSKGSNLPKKFLFNAGLHIPIGDSAKLISINPDVVYLKQRDFNMTITTVTVRLKYALIGVGAKTNSGFIFSVGAEGEYFRFCYSYDTEHSLLANATGVSHEFSFAIKIANIFPKKGSWTAINLEAI